jgi:hypothetical protein
VKKTFKLTLVVSAVALLAACGGGGKSATLAPFTSWADLQPNKTIQVDGISQSGVYTYDIGRNVVVGRSITPASGGASYQTKLDSANNATQTVINPAGASSVSWDRAKDFYGYLIINPAVDVLVSADGSRRALAANPYDYGWSYQSFGVWSTGVGTGSGTYGVISVGAMTPGAAIPTNGVASYVGTSGGQYIDRSGRDYTVGADMRANVNFSTRSIAFETSGTGQTRDLINVSGNSGLDMRGNLSYSPSNNSIVGGVSTRNGLNGSVTARFYGPSAQEIGGTFSLENGGIEGYVGAFGGKR